MTSYIFLHIPLASSSAAPVGEGAVDGTVAGLLLFIGIALLTSFLCSIWEAVLLSTSLSHVELLVQQGKRSGHIMSRLKDNIEQPIAAILTLNTIAHTVGAAGAGAQAVGIFGSEFVGIISAVLTLLILVFSEIIPKTLGAAYWKQLTPFTAYSVQTLVYILYPAVWAFQKLTRVIANKTEEPRVSRSELEILAHIGAVEGSLDEGENRILKNLLQLGSGQVADIMTPRTVVLAMRASTTVGAVMQKHKAIPYSRIPIFTESFDDITSYVLSQDILTAAAEDLDDLPLHDLARPIHSVPQSLPLDKVLEEFISRKEHIFLVFDEYGGMDGVITLEDTLETLLGVEITDESDLVADMRLLAQQRYNRHLKLLERAQAEAPLQTTEFPPAVGSES